MREQFFESVTTGFEVVGVGVMIIGIVVAFVISARTLLRTRSGSSALSSLRHSFGGVLLLGLEILVAADLVKTVTSAPSLTDAAVLGLIVLIRTVLSFSLQVEMEGVLPWKRALVTGPQIIAAAARASGETPPAGPSTRSAADGLT